MNINTNTKAFDWCYSYVLIKTPSFFSRQVSLLLSESALERMQSTGIDHYKSAMSFEDPV